VDHNGARGSGPAIDRRIREKYRNSQAALVLRSRAERGVSKDTPGGANEAASWTILRDAMLRIAPQDEAMGSAPAAVGITLGVTKCHNMAPKPMKCNET
jgi:hypothetical protein